LPTVLAAEGSLAVWGADAEVAFIGFILCGWFENEAGVHTPGVLRKSAEQFDGKGFRQTLFFEECGRVLKQVS
jgi:hypothetical protein